MDLQNRISINPNICHGQPCIKGTRILASNILAALSENLSTDEILQDFPGITQEDIQACLAFANDLLDEKKWSSEPDAVAV